MPRIVEEGVIDPWAHLQSVRRPVFALFGVYFMLDLPDTLLKGWPYFLQQLPQAVAVPAVNLLTAIVAGSTRSRRVLAVWVVFIWLYVLAMPLLTRTMSTLN